MSFLARTDHTSFSISTVLSEVIGRLRAVTNEMAASGLTDEAGTLETTIDDLEWQYEDLIEKELIGQWPNGPRRPVRLTPERTRFPRRRIRP